MVTVSLCSSQKFNATRGPRSPNFTPDDSILRLYALTVGSGKVGRLSHRKPSFWDECHFAKPMDLTLNFKGFRGIPSISAIRMFH